MAAPEAGERQDAPRPGAGGAALSERQRQVLRAVATGYLCDPSPIASATVSCLLPVQISSASIRATMAELTELGMLEKPHASAGRVPTEAGLRHFVEELLRPGDVAAWDRRHLARTFDELEARPLGAALQSAGDALSHHTGQLGFVATPALEHLVLHHVSLVRLSRERLLVVLVARTGQAHQRVIDDPGGGDQAELDRVAALLNERVAGRTLPVIRARLERELEGLRDRVDRVRRRAVELGLRVSARDAAGEGELLIATRVALLQQPEFQDPERIRELFSTLEERERLAEVLDSVLAKCEVSVTFGADLDDPGLRHCAVVAAPYGGDRGDPARGALGVIGPSRMDYARIIPLVRYCSRLVTERLKP